MRLFKQNMTWNRAHDSKALFKTCCYNWRGWLSGERACHTSEGPEFKSPEHNGSRCSSHVCTAGSAPVGVWEAEVGFVQACRAASMVYATKKNRKALSENKLGGKNWIRLSSALHTYTMTHTHTRMCIHKTTYIVCTSHPMIKEKHIVNIFSTT